MTKILQIVAACMVIAVCIGKGGLFEGGGEEAAPDKLLVAIPPPENLVLRTDPDQRFNQTPEPQPQLHYMPVDDCEEPIEIISEESRRNKVRRLLERLGTLLHRNHRHAEKHS